MGYVTREEFERVQIMRQPNRGRVQKGTSEDHPARRKSTNLFLLTGILKCGYCGFAMVSNSNGQGEEPLYRCDWRHRAGKEVCQQTSVVAYALHDIVCEWMAREIVTFERLVSLREQFNAGLSGSSQTLRARADHLRGELDRVAKQIGHLLTAIERGGWTEEIQERLDTRKREKLQIETDLAGIEQKLKMGNLKVSDEVLHYMADHFAEALASRHPDYARQLIQVVIPEAELYKEKLRLHYTPEILMETLTLSVAQGITGLWTVPPWEFESQF